MKKALVFEAARTGYGIDQIESPMTIGQLKELLEDFDDDMLFILSHDRGYTYGSIQPEYSAVFEEHEDGEWQEREEW